MDTEFTDKVVIVTGASGGIGSATCLAFGELGATVIAADIKSDQFQNLQETFAELSGTIDCREVDITQSQNCADFVENIIQQYGRIDILFNNAGTTCRADVIETTEQEWDLVMQVNLKSIFLMSKYALPHMVKARSGNIINTASGWGINGGAKAVSYCASKGGVVLLTKAMAIDHGPDNIRVNCICPGDTETGMLRNEAEQLGLPSDQLIKDGDQRPLGRVGQPSEIADAVIYLASSKSSFVTGTPLIVDGGGLAGSD